MITLGESAVHLHVRRPELMSFALSKWEPFVHGVDNPAAGKGKGKK